MFTIIISLICENYKNYSKGREREFSLGKKGIKSDDLKRSRIFYIDECILTYKEFI